MVASYYQADQQSAFDAKNKALELAFAPVVFQVTAALLELGILSAISGSGQRGATLAELVEAVEVSEYGVSVLLDVATSAKLVWQQDSRYHLDKTGYFLLTDPMVRVNFNFTRDVCYEGLVKLVESIKTGLPKGLSVFGEWETIYPGLHSLPEPAKQSWFAFDHYYSDLSFPQVLPVVFAKPVSRLFDIGGNTGKWTRACLAHDDTVKVTLVDLPVEIEVAKAELARDGLDNRVDYVEMDLLQEGNVLPSGADVIWMSQFLDCFSKPQILKILQCAAAAMSRDSRLYILELFWDRQQYEAAAFSINCTSIYFTCFANGNSRMYHSKELIGLLHEAGLVIEQDIDGLGRGHTLLGCRKIA